MVENQAMEIQEAVEVEYKNQVTLFGTAAEYSWEPGVTRELKVNFCTFNTQIGEDMYSIEVGIDENNVTTGILSYNAEVNQEVVNFMVHHMLNSTVEVSKGNDDIFYNREEVVDVDAYVVMTPVVEMVAILHGWANIALFAGNNAQNTAGYEEQLVEEEAVQEEVVEAQ